MLGQPRDAYADEAGTEAGVPLAGDHALGTFEHLDGEMVIVGGRAI
jgi:hypothetical protein